MFNRTIYLLSIILVLTLALSNVVSGANYKKHEIEPLLEVAKKIQGDILGYSVLGYIKVQDLTEEEIVMILREMGYTKGVTKENYYFEEGNKTVLVDWHNGKCYYKLVVYYGQETQVVLSVDTGKEVDITKIYDKVKGVLLRYNDNVHISTSIYQHLPKKLTTGEIVEKIYLSFNHLSAKLTLDYQGEGESYGFLGYSPYLGNTIESQGRKVNLHIAVYLDEHKGGYYLIIANPIIAASY
ncbi:YwmB family TATA-box binding protein [Anaerobranca gottschalkii]|uniref:TATA-box binding n=1 Tax=Anaerobranca gottschalkii DSM 13577 TaxID=1120990 RepID=A0A1I0CHW0_9FIRM|nr:YwmB family TATA-box binding protein [Anaerobranca gottschalkii]SET18555.1 TATA-box binding [Anaerobranca gottschalkii DSM 13577]